MCVPLKQFSYTTPDSYYPISGSSFREFFRICVWIYEAQCNCSWMHTINGSVQLVMFFDTCLPFFSLNQSFSREYWYIGKASVSSMTVLLNFTRNLHQLDQWKLSHCMWKTLGVSFSRSYDSLNFVRDTHTVCSTLMMTDPLGMSWKIRCW